MALVAGVQPVVPNPVFPSAYFQPSNESQRVLNPVRDLLSPEVASGKSIGSSQYSSTVNWCTKLNKMNFPGQGLLS